MSIIQESESTNNKKYDYYFLREYKTPQKSLDSMSFEQNKMHLELASVLTRNEDLVLLTILIFPMNNSVNNFQHMIPGMSESISYRKFDDEEKEFTTHEITGHTIPVYPVLSDDGKFYKEILVHDFKLLPYDIAKQGIPLTLYLPFTIVTTDESKVAHINLTIQNGSTTRIKPYTKLRIPKTIDYENSDGKTMKMKMKMKIETYL